MREIVYAYSMNIDSSLKFVAQAYIDVLKNHFSVHGIPNASFYYFSFRRYDIFVLHPVFYSLNLDNKNIQRMQLQYIRRFKVRVGVDLADSDRICDDCVRIINDNFDHAIVNSQWSYDAYKNSGVNIPIHIVEHYYDPAFERPVDDNKVSKEIRFIEAQKAKTKQKIILFFAWHSPWRKGYDLFHAIAKKLQEKRNDILFVVKSWVPITEFSDLKMINVTGLLKKEDIIKLYDIADVLLLTSRGGSFELNCLEAMVRGIPCIATRGGAWAEYFPPELQQNLVESNGKPLVLPGNKIHTGYGVQMDIDKAVQRVLEVLDNLEEEKAKVKKAFPFFKERYSRETIERKIVDVFNKF